MRFLIIGDVVGRPGRRAVAHLMSRIQSEHKPDFVIANGENAAGGNGITRVVADELFGLGVDVLTMGNHVWDQKEAVTFLDEEPRIVRPANYPPGTPGQGVSIYRTKSGEQLAVINLCGRVFQASLDCPFRIGDGLVEQSLRRTPVILVDFHAEATSEKQAFAWFMDGRVSAVWGTHTHVQTSDARILPGGTGFITDVGMTGPRNSILGIKPEIIIRRFLTQMPARFEVAGEPLQLDAAVVDVDPASGKTVNIRAIRYLIDKIE